GRRCLAEAGRVVGWPGPLVSRGARPGAGEAREWLPLSALRWLALRRAGPGAIRPERPGGAAALFPGRPQRGVHLGRGGGPASDVAEQVPGVGLAAALSRGLAAARTD